MISNKDLTIFTFRLGKPCENSLIYKMCEASWIEVMPGVKIEKIDLNQALKEYKDCDWFKWLQENGDNFIGHYLDALKIFYAQKWERSIYLDSDIYLYKNPIDNINKSDKSYLTSYSYFYSKRGDSDFKTVYNFYNKNFLNYKIINNCIDKKTNKIVSRLPTDYQIVNYIIDDKTLIFEADHLNIKPNRTYIFISLSQQEKTSFYTYISKNTDNLLTDETVDIIIEEPSSYRYFTYLGSNLYTTFNSIKLRNIMIDYCGRLNQIPKTVNYNLSDLLKLKTINLKFKLFIQHTLK